MTEVTLKTIIDGRMKYSKTCRLLASSIAIAVLLIMVVGAVPVAGASVKLSTDEGKIGDWVDVEYTGSGTVRFYFSSDKASVGDTINNQVRAYMTITIDTFRVPDRLVDGSYERDVHGGEYYVYAASASKEIVASTTFTVIAGEIWLEPEEGGVGDEVEISGEDLRPDQAISVEYEDDEVGITGGDIMTDSEGKFTCTVVIPDSVMGEHIIIVADESGDKPEAVFTVEPKITLVPAEQEGGKPVEVIGAGFRAEYAITLTLDGDRVDTTPYYTETDLQGSFGCVFAAPLYESPTTIKVVASDRNVNKAEAQLVVLGGIRLGPVTTTASPGHAGMELTIYGAGFASGAAVTITYNEGDAVVATETATADANGNFTTVFTVPPSVAGSHVIKAADGSTTGTASFIMESEAPPVPVAQLPETAGTAEEKARFDWGDVTDPSGVSYTLQVASDVDFNNIVVEKNNLPISEYTLTEGEELAPAGQKAYYWRIRAVDGASNEGVWSLVGLFYVGFSRTAMSGGVWYIIYGLVALVLVGLIFWFYKRRSR
ncbi:hypothetical protein ES708_06941 [subsurface metagenome]